MERIINKIKIFPNDNEKSKYILENVEESLNKKGFKIVDDNNFDLGIAIGGDGSFLRMVKNMKFSSNVYYIGINAGTLGFLQEINPSDTNKFIDKLNNNNFKIENIGIQETTIKLEDKNITFNSLNEILLNRQDLRTTNLDIYISDEFLERFSGDGLIISTSTGSTAHNLSYHGSIVYNLFPSLQITPMGPLDTSSYRCLRNSIVLPEELKIKLYPIKESNNLNVIIDGEKKEYSDIQSIETSVRDKKIKCLRMNDYSYPKIINSKFLK